MVAKGRQRMKISLEGGLHNRVVICDMCKVAEFTKQACLLAHFTFRLILMAIFREKIGGNRCS